MTVGTGKFKKGDKVRLFGSYLNSASGCKNKTEKFGTVIDGPMKSIARADKSECYKIKFDDPGDWARGVDPWWGEDNMEKVELKVGDKVKVLHDGYGLKGSTGIITSMTDTRTSLKLDVIPVSWGLPTVTVRTNELELVNQFENHDGFKQKLYDYLLSKNNNEHRTAYDLVHKNCGWFSDDEQLYAYVEKLLKDNPQGWCDSGIKRARAALGIPAPVVQKAMFTIEVELTDKASLPSIRSELIKKLESTKGVGRVSNVVYTAGSSRK